MTIPIKETITAVSELVRMGAANPAMQQTGQQVAKAMLTVSTTVNNCLLPLAAVNYGIETAKYYFQHHLLGDIASATAHIPAEHVVEPKHSIAGPALQGLAFAHEEVELRTMYLALLATAMDSRAPSAAHPAFAEIIKQLVASEAPLLKALCQLRQVAIVEIRIATEANTERWDIGARHVLGLVDDDGKHTEEPDLASYVDNWIRLGLFDVNYDVYLSGPNGEDKYGWVTERPEWLRLSENNPPPKKVIHQRGVLILTSFGRRFADAVVVPSESSAGPTSVRSL